MTMFEFGSTRRSSLFCVGALVVFAPLASCGGNGNGAPDMAGGIGDGALSDTKQTVHGKVVDVRGKPIAGLIVQIEEAIALSAIDGTFSIPTAGTPYRLMVGGRIPISTSPPSSTYYRSVTVYDQLTRLDPVVHMYGADASQEQPSNSATVTGIFSGLTTPLRYYGNLSADVSGSVRKFYPDANNLTFSNVAVQWEGTEKMKMTTLRGLFWFGSANTMTYWTGEARVTLQDKSNIGIADPIPLTPPEAGTITGQVKLPNSVPSRVDFYPTLHYTDENEISMESFSVPAGVFTFNSAKIDGATFEFRIGAQVDRGTSVAAVAGLASGATVPPITLPTPTMLVRPVDGSTGITATRDFEVLPGATGLIHVVHFYQNDQAGRSSWTLVTPSNTFHFPDGSSIGVALPRPGLEVDWYATSVSVPAVDTLAGEGDFHNGHLAMPGTPLLYSSSETNSFQM